MSVKRKRKDRREESSGASLRSVPTGSPPSAVVPKPADWRVCLVLSAAVLLLSGGLLFFRLGYYPLWGDESETAIFARGVARTGDTVAMIGHNLYAFRGGSLLKNLCDRYVPPASFYLAAPFVGRNGTSSLWPRLPFAICGLLSVVLILYWMYRCGDCPNFRVNENGTVPFSARSGLSTSFWIVMSIGLLSNVSFFLYCRQCRYYSLAILLTLVIAYLYLNWNGRISGIIAMMAISILLLATHYLPYAGLYTVLACDYFLFHRRRQRLKLGQWLVLLVPQAIIGGVVVWIFNPVGAGVVPDEPGGNLILNKLTLIWWYFRDLNNCEFCVGIVMLAAPLVYLWTRNIWLLRGTVAVVCYTLVVAILTPQPVTMTRVADIRYLTPLIPLCIGLSTLVIVSLAKNIWLFALPMAVVIFGTNVLNYPFSPDQWCSRPVEYVKELCNPRATAIGMAVDWVKENVGDGQSVWVLPDYNEPSLMYHAPQPIYAWQLSDPPQEQFAALPPIHFFGRIPPDYFVVFGPFRMHVENLIQNMKKQGVEYQLVKPLGIYWDDSTRPEIFWRSFVPIKNYNPQVEDVYVYRRVIR